MASVTYGTVWPTWVATGPVTYTYGDSYGVYGASADTSATTCYGQVVWTQWIGTDTDATTSGSIICSPYTPVEGAWTVWTEAAVETLEQRNARLAEESARQERYAEEARKRAEEDAAAQAKARELLLSVLSKKESDQLAKLGYFEVLSSRNNRFRIYNGTHGNVKRVLSDGKIGVSLCGQPGGVPTCDAMLAQKLMLETCEEEYLKVANPTMLLHGTGDSEAVKEAQAIVDEARRLKTEARNAGPAVAV